MSGENTHRGGRPPKARPRVWAREATWNATRRAAHRRLILAQLREAFGGGEVALIGWCAICSWLNGHGFRNREGGSVTDRVARGWRLRLALPVLRGRPGRPGRWPGSIPWTSNYLLLAWAASLYRSGGPELPRIIAEKHTDSTMDFASDVRAPAARQHVAMPVGSAELERRSLASSLRARCVK